MTGTQSVEVFDVPGGDSPLFMDLVAQALYRPEAAPEPTREV